MEEQLNRLREFFDNFAPASLQRLDEIYTDDVQFEDPLNRCKGIKSLREIFQDTFRQLKKLEFEVGGIQRHQASVFMRWTMRYRLRGRSFSIEGMSELILDEAGCIRSQRDFWDASFVVYGQFPGVGCLLRGLRRLVSKYSSPSYP